MKVSQRDERKTIQKTYLPLLAIVSKFTNMIYVSICLFILITEKKKFFMEFFFLICM